MQVTVNWVTFDTQAPGDTRSGVTPIAQIEWAELDTNAAVRVDVTWAVFDTAYLGTRVDVAWAEFDIGPPVRQVVPVPQSGGSSPGKSRYPTVRQYYNADTQKYEIPVFNVSEEEEELVILQLLFEIAQDELS
jgi:hypothetical protein